MTGVAQTYPQLAVQLAGRDWAPGELASVRRAYELAALLFAAAVRGSGKPFVDHLVGTASCLVIDHAPATEVAAALLHAAYDQGDFGDRRTGATSRHRDRVRAEVGDEVEGIVAAYHALGWGRDVAASVGVSLDELTPATRAALRVRLANEVDEALDAGLVLSGKAAIVGAAAVPAAVVLDLAGRVAGPEFVACARATLTAPMPAIPPELVIGCGRSTVQLPASARPSAPIRAVVLARRVLRRVPGPVRRPIARAVAQRRASRRRREIPSAPTS